MQTTFSCYLSC